MIAIHYVVSRLLGHVTRSSTRDNPRPFLDVVQSIRGPFAIIYFDAQQQLLWFCRDVLGRRSLLWNHADGAESFPSSLYLTSVWSTAAAEGSSGEQMFYEVPAGNVYCLDIGQFLQCNTQALMAYSWESPDADLGATSLTRPFARLNFQQAIDMQERLVNDRFKPYMDDAVERFQHQLDTAVRMRVGHLPQFW